MDDGSVYFGSDPGKTGANVCLTHDGTVVFGHDMPTDDEELADLWYSIAKSYSSVYIVVEKVWSNPKWGKRHCFEFGRQKGRLEMSITAAGLSFFRIQPTTWQKHFGMAKTPEERSGYKGQRLWKKRLQAKAIEIFDGRVTLSRADAYLMAEYCRNNVQEGTLCH